MITPTSGIDTRLNAARAMISPATMAEAYSGGNWRRARHLNVIDWEFRNLLASPDLDVLIVRMPVRHGKSEYLGRWAPAWYMLRHPERRLIVTTHTARLARAHSKWIRDRVHELAPLVGFKGVDPTKSSAIEWDIEGAGMGGCVAAGVGGALAGYGADLLIIDDYIKGFSDATSEAKRDNVWDWWVTTSSTRLSPNGKVVILCTSWHEDDLIGRILRQREEGGLRVRSITMQAIRDSAAVPRDPLRRADGEALWPERWPAERLLRMKNSMQAHWWSAIYQGRPGPHGANAWPAHYFESIWCSEDEWPGEKIKLSAAHLDPSKGKNAKAGDYSAAVFVGYHDGKVWVDSDIDRRPVPQMVRDYARFCNDRRPYLTGIEGNAFQELLGGEYEEACEEIGYAVTEPHLDINTINKTLRIERIGSWLAKRHLRFRRTRSNELLVQQLREFPNAKHDDGPDALEAALRLLTDSVREIWEWHEADSALIAA